MSPDRDLPARVVQLEAQVTALQGEVAQLKENVNSLLLASATFSLPKGRREK